jgi:hypothetical protein
VEWDRRRVEGGGRERSAKKGSRKMLERGGEGGEGHTDVQRHNFLCLHAFLDLFLFFSLHFTTLQVESESTDQ